MQTEDQANVSDNLDEFEDTFYGNANPATEESQPSGEDAATDPDAETAEAEADKAEAKAAEAEGEDADDSQADDAGEKPRKKKLTAQERINQAIYRQREAERRAEEAERRLAETQPADQGQAQTQDASQDTGQEKPAEEPTPPDPNDTEKYPYGEVDSNYIRDLSTYHAEKRFAELEKDRREREEQERQQAEQQRRDEEIKAKWEERKADAVAQYPDFDEVVNQTEWPFTQPMVAAIANSENGPHIAYHLAKNPDQAREITEMSPESQFMAIGRIEAQFANTGAQPEPASEGNTETAERLANAPEPPETRARGAGGQHTVRPDTDNLEAFEGIFYGS